MKSERIMRMIRRRIATVLMLVVMITQSPVAELFGTGVIRAQALEPADISIWRDWEKVEGAPSYGDELTVKSSQEIASYQWKRDGVDIAGATGATYLVSTNDINKQLSVQLTGADETVCTIPVGDGMVSKAGVYIEMGDYEYDGCIYNFTAIVRKNYYVDEKAADPTGKADLEYAVYPPMIGDGPMTELEWKTLVEDLPINTEYQWTVPEEAKGNYVKLRLSYKGDVNYEQTTEDFFDISFIEPSIGSVSPVSVSGNEYSFTVSMDYIGDVFEAGNVFWILTLASLNGYDSFSAADVKKNYDGSREISGSDFDGEDGNKLQMTIDGSTFAIGKYVFQIVINDFWGNLSNKVVTSEFTVGNGTVFSASDLSATVSGQLVYNGAEQTPSVSLNAVGDNAEAVGAWLKNALANGKISYSFLQITDGNGTAVQGAVKSAKIKAAGSYEIYASSSDDVVSISNVALGSFNVSKAKTDAPDAKPVLNATVSEDKTAFVINVDTSAVTNAAGKIMEFSFNGEAYSAEHSYIAGAEEDVKVSIRYAESLNTVSSDSVSSDMIKTAGRSHTPSITPDTVFEVSQNVVISTSVSDSEIYYTIDGTEPTVKHFKAKGKGKVEFSVSQSVVVKAVAAEDGKLLSESVSANYTLYEKPVVEDVFIIDAQQVSGNKIKIYTVSDDEVSLNSVSADQTMLVSVISSVSADGSIDVLEAERVKTDSDGCIDIADNWIGKDVMIVAEHISESSASENTISGNTISGNDASDAPGVVHSKPVYLPVIRFITDRIVAYSATPKDGEQIYSTVETNIPSVSANISWSGMEVSTNKAVTVSAGDVFRKGVSYNATISFSTNSEKSVLDDQLELVQFDADYDVLPYVSGAKVGVVKERVKNVIERKDGRSVGRDNYTGFTVEADFGEVTDVVKIESVLITDWKDIEWTENTGTANYTEINGYVLPLNADEKLTVSMADTIVNGSVIAGASADADDVVKSVSISEADAYGRFTIRVQGSDKLHAGGFATLHLDTDLGDSKALEDYKDILVRVSYEDVTGVSVNRIVSNKDDGAVYTNIEITGLIPGEMYAVTMIVPDKSTSENSASENSVSVNSASENSASENSASENTASENSIVIAGTYTYTADSEGKIRDIRFRNYDLVIQRTSPKIEFYHKDTAKNADWKVYTELLGKEKYFDAALTTVQASTGLFYVIENADNIVYTGNKITPVVHVYEGDRELIEGQDFTVSFKKNKDAGNAEAIIKSKNGSNVEKNTLIFEIKKANIADALIVDVQSVKGKAGKQPVVVYNGLMMAQRKTYNKIAKSDLKIAVGESRTVEIQGIGNFEGTASFNVIGVGKKATIKGVRLVTKKFAYMGHGKFDASQIVVAGVNDDNADIILPDEEGFKMGNAGSYKLAVVGKGEYAGFVKFLAFKITPCKIASFKLKETSFIYDPRGVILEEGQYELTGIGDEKLIKGMDYTATYKKNKKVGTAKVTVTFKGSYKGTKKASATFAIEKADIATALEEVFVAPVATEKKAKKNPVYLVDNDVLLKKGKKADYTTSYMGGGKMQIQGAGNYYGSLEVEFAIVNLDDVSKAKVKISKGQKFCFNGLPFSNTAEGANHVDVTCSKTNGVNFRFFNNVNKGKAVVVAYGDGVNSTGSKAAKFKIKGALSPNELD